MNIFSVIMIISYFPLLCLTGFTVFKLNQLEQRLAKIDAQVWAQNVQLDRNTTLLGETILQSDDDHATLIMLMNEIYSPPKDLLPDDEN